MLMQGSPHAVTLVTLLVSRMDVVVISSVTILEIVVLIYKLFLAFLVS